jgi:hypothetical protein
MATVPPNPASSAPRVIAAPTWLLPLAIFGLAMLLVCGGVLSILLAFTRPSAPPAPPSTTAEEVEGPVVELEPPPPPGRPRPKPIEPAPPPMKTPKEVPAHLAQRVFQPAKHSVATELPAGAIRRLFLAYPFNDPVVGVLLQPDDATKLRLEKYDVATGLLVDTLDLPAPALNSPGRMDLSPDGHFFAIEDKPNLINVWSLTEKKQVVKEFTLPKQAKVVNSGLLAGMYFMGDSKLLTIAGTGRVAEYDVPEMKEVLTTPPLSAFTVAKTPLSESLGVAISPNRNLLALWNGSSFTLLDLNRGRPIGTTAALKLAGPVKRIAVAFNPEGTRLAVLATFTAPNAEVDTVTLADFDVKGGKLRSQADLPTLAGMPVFSQLRWFGAEHVLAGDRFFHITHVIEVKGAMPIARLEIPDRMGAQARLTPGLSLWYAAMPPESEWATFAAVEMPTKFPTAPVLLGTAITVPAYTLTPWGLMLAE